VIDPGTMLWSVQRVRSGQPITSCDAEEDRP